MPLGGGSRPDQLRVGIAGLGRAGAAMLSALARHPQVRVVAAARPDSCGMAQFAQDFQAETYRTVEDLCASTTVDAVYIATPTELHAEHAIIAAQAGKHILLEKPMAVTLDEAHAIIAAAEKGHVKVLVGHSHSYDPPIRAMRAVTQAGDLGSVRMINNWYFSDWWYRPRRPAELDDTRGGGVTLRQGAHQFDIIRYLGGGLINSVRAATASWDPLRPGLGSHTVFMEFANGIAATAVYSGYDHFRSSELTFGVTEAGSSASAHAYAGARRRLRAAGGRGEAELKQGMAYPVQGTQFEGAEHQPFFGLTIVSCERGDIRQSPDGLFVYGENEVSEVPVSGAQTPRDIVVSELYDAVVGGVPAIHDGRWGLATLEVCLAALESARSHKEILLTQQVAVDR
jgi:phthalate 4,5-cis-dihydrodiol dehydrogenase